MGWVEARAPGKAAVVMAMASTVVAPVGVAGGQERAAVLVEAVALLAQAVLRVGALDAV